jgi:hypothetical protein
MKSDESISAQASVLLDGYVSEEEMAKARKKGLRALRAERQRGVGPPYVKDGRATLYSVEGYKQYLKSNERRPVRNRPTA